MPDTQAAPDVQDVAEFTLPPVPLREGEEKFAAGLNLEHARRTEERRADLQQQLRELGQDSAASEIVAKSKVGKAERDRQRLVRIKVRELKDSGQSPPATVINLNPVQLELYGLLRGYNVAPCGKGLPIELKYRGRTFTGSYMTISTPKVWLKTIGSTGDPTGDRPTFSASHIPPIGIAHQFYLSYCSGTASGQRMGGIVIFQGDIHTLDKHRLDQAGRKLKVPRGEWIPDLPGEVMFVTHERALDEYLAAELTQQRAYAELVIAQGHGYATSNAEDERKQLNNRHIIWHNYALEMGYIKNKLAWASERLQDSPLVEAVFCPDCRTRQEDPEQYFCRNCNSPFDAFKAFMAGKQVSPDRLAAYDEDSKEWKEIMAEMGRRRARMTLLEGAGEPKAKRGKET